MNSLPIIASAVGIDSARSPTFAQTLEQHGLPELDAHRITTLQVNVGKVCNQTCHHCHVDAGPQRTESMTLPTMEAILAVLTRHPEIGTVDITGGAPELNPLFEYFVEQCRDLGRRVIDRCNLTVFFVKGKERLPEFLATHHVDIIASLPCYIGDNVDRQRGKGVFHRSIEALQRLNRLGYGIAGSGLTLHLVYNPQGPTLPPSQEELEEDYKTELGQRYGISFNQLLTITNMPISRFLNDLQSRGEYETYMGLLVSSFNPASLDGLMCRSLISVGWDGQLYDCDFNQMLELSLSPRRQTIFDFDLQRLSRRSIVTGLHCYGCTAGSGSSCGGVLV